MRREMVMKVRVCVEEAGCGDQEAEMPLTGSILPFMVLVCAHCAKSCQLCLTLCDPVDYSQTPLSMGFSWHKHWCGCHPSSRGSS